MSPDRNEGFDQPNPAEVDAPEWMRDIATAYRSLDASDGMRRRELGTSDSPWLGKIDTEYSVSYTESVYSLVNKVMPVLPDFILVSDEMRFPPQVGVAIGSGSASLNFYPGSELRRQIYYIPRIDSILRISPDTQEDTIDPKHIPGTQEFVGLDELQSIKKPFYLDIFKLTHVINQAWGELSMSQLQRLAQEVGEYTAEKSEKEIYSEFQVQVERLKSERAENIASSEERWAQELQTRVHNMLSVARAYPGIYRRIPQHIETSSKYDDYDKEQDVHMGIWQMVFIRDTGELYKVPGRRNMGRFKRFQEEWNLDFDNKIPATQDDWLNNAMWIGYEIRDSLPKSKLLDKLTRG